MSELSTLRRVSRRALIIVTGDPESGRSTLGRLLAEALHVTYVGK